MKNLADDRSEGRPAWVPLLSALVLVLTSCGWAEPSPASPSLIVWVVDTDTQGIAIALHDLGKAKKDSLSMLCYDSLDDFDKLGKGHEVGLDTLVRDLMRAPDVSPPIAGKPPDLLKRTGPKRMYPFRVLWKAGNPKVEYSIDFKFATPGSLTKAWKPLFEQCNSKANAPGKQALLLWKFISDYDSAEPAASKGQDWFPPYVPNLSLLYGLDWLGPFDADVKAGPNVVVLGPDNSDAAPALWFHFTTLGEVQVPPVVATAASSTLLKYPPSKPTCGAANGLHDKHCWHLALSRMMEFAIDDFPQAAKRDQGKVNRVVKAIGEVSGTFIQYPMPGEALVKAIVRQLVDVQGYRRIAVLYPARPDGGSPGGRSAAPSRLLFGPTLREDFENEFQHRRWIENRNLFIAMPLLAPPPNRHPPSEQADADKEYQGWLSKVRRQLLPLLRYYEKAGIQAVGVFGDTKSKVAILNLVREQIPSACLFTSDADWQLESPVPVDNDNASSASPGEEGKTKADSNAATPAGYKLDGLLVVTSPEPNPEWVTETHKALNSLADDLPDPFLPNIHRFYASHVVTRLFQLVQHKKTCLLATPRDPHRREWFRSNGDPTSLEGYLRGRSEEPDDPTGQDDQASGFGIPQIMVVRDGRLGIMQEDRLGKPFWVLTLVGCVVLPLGSFLVVANQGVRPLVKEPKTLLERIATSYSELAKRIGSRNGRENQQPPATGAAGPGMPPTPGPESSPRAETPVGSVPRTSLERVAAGVRKLIIRLVAAIRLAVWPAERGERALSPIKLIDLPGFHFIVAASLIGAGIFLVLGCVWIDTREWILDLPVSLKILPDHHSVLPTIYLEGLAGLLALYLPFRFKNELDRNGSFRTAPDQDDDRWGLKRWSPPLDKMREAVFQKFILDWKNHQIYTHLYNSRSEWTWAVVLAGLLVSVDVLAGLPVPGSPTFLGWDSPLTGWLMVGFTKVGLALYEFGILLILLLTGWTFVEMGRAVVRLCPGETTPDEPGLGPAPAQAGTTRMDDILGAMEPESVRRLGSIFIEMVAYALIIYALLLLARLPSIGMARWRWDLWGAPIGFAIFVAGLIFIISYWFFCYRTFSLLIRQIKNARLAELDKARLSQLAIAGADADVEKLSEDFADRRRSIEEISEEPWKPGGARQAWIALTLALLPPLMSLLLGHWGEVIVKPLSQAIGSAVGG